MVQTRQIPAVCKRRDTDAARTHVEMGNVAVKRRTSSRTPYRHTYESNGRIIKWRTDFGMMIMICA